MCTWRHLKTWIVIDSLNNSWRDLQTAATYENSSSLLHDGIDRSQPHTDGLARMVGEYYYCHRLMVCSCIISEGGWTTKIWTYCIYTYLVFPINYHIYNRWIYNLTCYLSFQNKNYGSEITLKMLKSSIYLILYL